MKQASILLVLVWLWIPTQAQTPKEKFITYNLQIDRAKTAAAHGDHLAAMAVYDSAFKLVPFMAEDYFDAVVNALRAGNDGRANDLLIQATENGFTVEGRYDSLLQAFLYSDRSMPYLNMRDYMKARWLEHADTVMIRKLNDIGSWEGMMVDGNGSINPFIDSTSYYRLLAFVKDNGWPTPLTVGRDFRLAFHALPEPVADLPQDPTWKQVLPYIRSAIDRGTLPPDCLAPYQDMADLAQGRAMTYGALLDFFWELPPTWSVVERATLEKNRRSVGLGPFDDLLFRLRMDPKKVRYAAQ